MVSSRLTGRFRGDVQGLRGVAVLLVVLYHADGIVPGGFVGVDVFFVISGFVIARGLIGEADRAGRVDLATFYTRRIRRLAPALAVMLAVVALTAVVLQSPFAGTQDYSLRTALAAALSSANLFLWARGGGYFSPLDEANPFLHTWSLGVEEQFYLAFPLGMYLVYRSAGGRVEKARRRALLVTGVVTVTSFVLSWILVDDLAGLAAAVPKPGRFAFYLPLTRAWQFGVGILIAVLSIDRRRRSVDPALSLIGVTSILVAALRFEATTPYPGLAALLPTIGTGLVIAASAGPVTTVLQQRWLTWVGDISYSWYLWHWPAIVFTRLQFPRSTVAEVVAGFGSLVLAVTSHRFVEARFRSDRDASLGSERPVRTRSILAAGVALPVVVAGVFATGVLDPADLLEDHPELEVKSLAGEFGCYGSSTDLDRCRFGGDADPAGIIMLVGDSHAAAISGAVVDAGEELGYEVVVSTMAACPFVTVDVIDNDRCAIKRQATLQLIERLRPDLTVVANRSTISSLRIELGLDVRQDAIRTASEEALATWASAVRQTATDLQPLTGRVAIMSEAPQMHPDDFVHALPSLVRPDGTDPVLGGGELDRARRTVVSAENDALADLGFVTVLDPARHLCADDRCPLRLNGTFLYRDNHHLSVGAQQALAGPFAELFATLGDDGAAEADHST